MPARLPAHLIEAGRGAHLATWINAKLATKILTISEWSKKDLVELYGLAPDKVKVTYLGFDRSIFNESVPDYEASVSLLKRLGITRPFLVHHGMIQLRKNLDRLIRSWDLLRRRYRDLDVQLVLAGSMGKGHQQILAAREATAYPQDVIFTDALPNHELGVLLKNASLCVIPSLYEGFCLPLIEAMACGVPTVASKSSCLPEISGKSLEYFDPYSVEDMADVIQRTLDDGDLQQRLRRKGLARAAEFSWERCARETLDTFEQSA
jgi:glycosyltransferase involved in cell wall biosynthesis